MECPICNGTMENGHCTRCGFCFSWGDFRGLVNPHTIIKYKYESNIKVI